MRNEDNQSFEAIDELVRIAKEGGLPGQIDHIKLGSARVWGRTKDVFARMATANVQADVYPYLYWQSTIRVIIPTEEFSSRALWTQGLADIGGPGHVLLTSFSPDPTWEGKTVEALAKAQGKDPISLIQEIIERCYGSGTKGSESVVVTAMSDDDLKAFIRNPTICFCSDGGLHGSHPRGAGSFPRVLGRYVREEHTISLQEAIRKMTSLPASRFGLKGPRADRAGQEGRSRAVRPDDGAGHRDHRRPPVAARRLADGVRERGRGDQRRHDHPRPSWASAEASIASVFGRRNRRPTCLRCLQRPLRMLSFCHSIEPESLLS